MVEARDPLSLKAQSRCTPEGRLPQPLSRNELFRVIHSAFHDVDVDRSRTKIPTIEMIGVYTIDLILVDGSSCELRLSVVPLG
jgi:hypothetical protein